MHIVNVMFGRGLGGIEQALVDYCEALKMEGHKVTAIISKRAKIKPALLPLGINIIEVKNFSAWDFLAKRYIKHVMGQLAPDAVIVHGNRAISLCTPFRICAQRNFIFKISNLKFKIIGVTHNYSIKRLIGLDAILATTNDLKNKVIEAGQPADKVFKLPNMVRVATKPSPSGRGRGEGTLDVANPAPVPAYSPPPIIGTMGRFVKKKGFDIFIRAIADLKGRGLDFKAVIGGGGEDENLKKLVTQLDLQDKIEFIGWVSNKQQFFDNIDVFVLPSLHEPFGIILLEAFAHGKPVVVTDSEGPSEIVENGVDSILVKKGDSKAMADGIAVLINNRELAAKIAQNGFAKAMNYDIKHFAASLSGTIKRIVNS